jgi:polyphosphate kinase
MDMRARFMELVDREIENHHAGRPARIICKMNQLEDGELCLLLSKASQAGVPIDLIVRGLCCLAPGVPGLTENIRLRSIVGRFLEHSRIFHFAAGSDNPVEGEFLIGSADWMHRNLSERVEAIVPIVDRHLRARLWEILQVCLDDRRNAWEMRPDGSYVQLHPDGADGWGDDGTHSTLMRLALARHGIGG